MRKMQEKIEENTDYDDLHDMLDHGMFTIFFFCATIFF